MQVKEFTDDPTGSHRQGKNHPAYDVSIFETVSAEYSIGEILLGSTYRGLLLERPESIIDLKKIEELPKNLSHEHFGDTEIWRNMLAQGQGGLASPIRGGQKTSTPLPQLMPLVPEIAFHACVLGVQGRSRWNPFNLLLNVIGGGQGNKGIELVERLSAALKVDNADDYFARFVARAFETTIDRPLIPPYLQMSSLSREYLRAFRGDAQINPSCSPAERFCKDLDAILPLKAKLTRRQWTVLIEAVLRIGMSMHILWVCYVNTASWQHILSVIDGKGVPPRDKIEVDLWQSYRNTKALLEFGYNAELLIRQLLEKYVFARFGINLLLCLLDEAGRPWPVDRPIGYEPENNSSAPEGIRLFLEHIANNKAQLDTVSGNHGGTNVAQWLRNTCSILIDDRSGLAKSRSGFTSNLLEFTRYSLGQVVTEDIEMRSYDQAYLLGNVGRKERPRWVARPGPAMLISLIHACCYAQGDIPASVEDFRSHLADYGLRIPTGELARGQIGSDLENLGLVVDSPDASGGRLLVDPF